MNRLVAQALQPAGLPDFRVRWTRNGRLESRPNPQARKPALLTRFASWSQCAKYDAEVTHEAERRAPTRRGVACPERADLEIGAPSTRFMAPMRARIGVVATHEPAGSGGSLARDLGNAGETPAPLFRRLPVAYA